jgi:hypothetical protein
LSTKIAFFQIRFGLDFSECQVAVSAHGEDIGGSVHRSNHVFVTSLGFVDAAKNVRFRARFTEHSALTQFISKTLSLNCQKMNTNCARQNVAESICCLRKLAAGAL